MDLTRRSFLAGIGAVSVGLLFQKKLDAVLDSLEQELVAEQQTPAQLPSAADIVVMPQMAFRPSRLVIPSACASFFVLEDIRIGTESQFALSAALSGELFSAEAQDAMMNFSVVAPGTEIRFRVRYIGSDPDGQVFHAALLGRNERGHICVLPITSGVAIV